MLEPEGNGKAFTGRGETIEEAANNAAGEVYRTFGRDTLVDLVRVQAVVTNPRVSEYRIVFVPAGP